MRNLYFKGVIFFLSILILTGCQATGDKALYSSKAYTIYGDSVTGQGFTARALSSTEMISDYKSAALHSSSDTTASHWKLSADISDLPQYHSDHALIEALYNMSLEEMQKDIRPDTAFMAGAKWDGVWTRDISYSTILSLVMLQPDICRSSLMKKVKNGMIIQDTGTGGSYPVSTDRMVWAIAAWEVYEVTGDRDWLQQAYAIIRNSAAADEQNIYDPHTGLVHGESSFMDWREQSYPRWMQPVDIYNSECLSTNAVHYEANRVLAAMAGLLGDSASSFKYNHIATGIKHAVNKYFWMPDKGYYGQYLYGRNFMILSPKSESLGEALCVLFDIASPEQQKEIMTKMPVLDFGVPCFYPQIPGIPPYHNDAIWPFVDAYWALAASKAGNGKALMTSMNSIYRAAALFLTNKENLVAADGDYMGTQINSGRQLWSVAGNLAMVYKMIFGMHFQTDSLRFAPFVPYTYRGKQSLTNLKYRKSILDIELTGHGNQIRSFSLDGNTPTDAVIPGSLTGRHTVKIVMADNNPGGKDNVVNNHFAPEMPVVALSGDTLRWQPIKDAIQYKVLMNGKIFAATSKIQVLVPVDEYAEFQVAAIDSSNFESFASEPVINIPSRLQQIYEVGKFATKSSLPYKGFSGKGFVEISKTKNTIIKFNITIPLSGWYAIDFRYANGNGPINTDNKCAMRSLMINSRRIGTLVFPQRGQDQWSNWGFSNARVLKLDKGEYPVSLELQPANANMNSAVNQAMLDYMRVVRVGDY